MSEKWTAAVQVWDIFHGQEGKGLGQTYSKLIAE